MSNISCNQKKRYWIKISKKYVYSCNYKANNLSLQAIKQKNRDNRQDYFKFIDNLSENETL